MTVLPSIAEVPKGAFDVDELLDKSGEILRREILNLLGASAHGKLDKAQSTDLVNYIRLLSELKNEQLKAAKEMSIEELEAASKK